MDPRRGTDLPSVHTYGRAKQKSNPLNKYRKVWQVALTLPCARRYPASSDTPHNTRGLHPSSTLPRCPCPSSSLGCMIPTLARSSDGISSHLVTGPGVGFCSVPRTFAASACHCSYIDAFCRFLPLIFSSHLFLLPLTMSSSDRYNNIHSRGRRTPSGDPQSSFFLGQGGRTVLPPITSAFPTSHFPGLFLL